jgi:hypothetical protein
LPSGVIAMPLPLMSPAPVANGDPATELSVPFAAML